MLWAAVGRDERCLSRVFAHCPELDDGAWLCYGKHSGVSMSLFSHGVRRRVQPGCVAVTVDHFFLVLLLVSSRKGSVQASGVIGKP